MDQADLFRRGAAEFVGTFTLIFIGAGLRTLAPEPPGPPETGLEEPRPGDAASI